MAVPTQWLVATEMKLALDGKVFAQEASQE